MKPAARRSTLLCLVPLLLFPLGGCGGKIAPVPSEFEDPASSASRTESAPSAAGAQAGASPESDCEAVCARNAHCGAFVDDCVASCLAQQSSACHSEAGAYFACYARTMDPVACAELDPSCEAAYCAYARCTGGPLDAACR
jgi:hypothetical protein